MTVIKSYWLRASILLIGFVLGVFALVGAMENDKETIKTTKMIVLQDQWYSVAKINASGPDDPSNFQITGTTSTPPALPNPNQCTQANNAGRYCAFKLEFDAAEDPASVIGQNLENAMENLNASQVGHARNPSEL